MPHNVMPHKLRVLPRLTADVAQAELRITGCLTPGGSTALRPLIRRTFCVIGVRSVVVDLSTARHIDPEGIELLHHFLQGPNPVRFGIQEDSVLIRVPPVLPSCPAYRGGPDRLGARGRL